MEGGGILVEVNSMIRAGAERPFGVADGFYIASGVYTIIGFGCNKAKQPEVGLVAAGCGLTWNAVGIVCTLATITTEIGKKLGL